MKAIKKYIWSVAALAVALTTTSCQTNEFGTIDLSGYTPEPTVKGYTYNHPCALYTAEEFEARKALLSSASCPAEVTAAFTALKANKYTNGNYGITVNAHKQLVRGDATGTTEGVETYPDAMRDAAAAYQFGLLWRLTGDTQYADKGINILNTWAATCQEITAADANQYLAAGGQGFTFALAGEELRDYSGWASDKFQVFKTWMKNVFATKNYNFLTKHANVTCGQTHYWSNWDLVNLCSYLQIGILCEDDDIVSYVANYFTGSGEGNGNVSNLCLGLKDDPLGSGEKMYQNQESGRDQGHAEMSTVVAIQLCQAAWALYQSNPNATKLNFFSQGDDAILKMAEYVALTNYTDASGNYLISASQIPFTTVGPWCTNPNHAPGVQHTAFSQVDRGGLRPNWEMLLSHYKALGTTGNTKYVKMMADKLRPELGSGDTNRYGDNSGAFDQIGWGTLMTYTPEDN